jgi:6-pyruvoyltetrahydropterin/6-carboxytetrahydropterin synthase
VIALTRVYHFSAAHRLASPALGPDESARLYGVCHRTHGHNYSVEVTVTGRPDPVTGMAVDLAALDTVVDRRVLSPLDHRNLDETVELAGAISTGENLARVIWTLLRPEVEGLARVVVRETAKNRFEYAGEGDRTP